MKYINKGFFSKFKGKLKLAKDKIVKRISIFSLSTVLLLTGCGVNQNTQLESNSYSTAYQQEYVTNDIAEVEEVKSNLPDEVLTLLDQKVSISEQEYENFYSYVEGITVDYENSEYFQLDQAYEKYKNISEYETVSSNIIKDGKIDEVKLKEKVIENNNSYLESTQTKKYTKLEDKMFNTILSHLVDTLNYQLETETDIDIGQLDDNLTILRIFRMTSPGSGMVTDDGIVAFNLEVIDTRQQQYPNLDYLRMTVVHEGKHLIQLSSEKEKEIEGYSRNLGMSYSWDDLNINSLFHTWYVEGSAEYLKSYEYKDSRTSNYENQVKTLETLTLATLPKEGVNETTLASLSLQPDLEKLFTLFNCRTGADKLEILQMMYSLEICLNQPVEFSNFYKESTGKTLDIYNYQDSLKSSVAQTLTKSFYENLASFTYSNETSLKDSFSIVSTFEVEMNRLTKYSNDYYEEANSDFLSMYMDIQNEYFGLLTSSLGMSTEELTTLYNSYYHDNISTVNQFNTSEGEAQFINEILQNRGNNRQRSINEMGKVKLK